MAANPLGAHQVGRGFADRATTHVVATFAGVPRDGADWHACFISESGYALPRRAMMCLAIGKAERVNDFETVAFGL
jgi:hypothetical protein